MVGEILVPFSQLPEFFIVEHFLAGTGAIPEGNTPFAVQGQQLVADVAIPLPRPRSLDVLHRPDFVALTEQLRHNIQSS